MCSLLTSKTRPSQKKNNKKNKTKQQNKKNKQKKQVAFLTEAMCFIHYKSDRTVIYITILKANSWYIVLSGCIKNYSGIINVYTIHITFYFCLLTCTSNPSEKGSILKGKNLLPLRIDPFSEGSRYGLQKQHTRVNIRVLFSWKDGRDTAGFASVAVKAIVVILFCFRQSAICSLKYLANPFLAYCGLILFALSTIVLPSSTT